MCRIMINDISTIVCNRESRGLGVRHECGKCAACERLKLIAAGAGFYAGIELELAITICDCHTRTAFM